jgi:hypothetical protein
MEDNKDNKKNTPIIRPTSARIPVERLLLDKENARLSSTSQATNQDDLLRTLWNEMAVIELALSIAANGFYDEEPLLVITDNPLEKDVNKCNYIVIEGNRRLAAVKLLRDISLQQKLKIGEFPKIDKARRDTLAELPVLIYPSREILWSYLGFRHINSPQPWDAYSKAKYVADVHEQYKVSLDEIATKIGDSHHTVTRLYRGYKILQQAESQAGFDREDRIRNKFYFSHLYTATDQGEFQTFLGINPKDPIGDNPVPKSKIGALKELAIWLYGRKSDNIRPLVESQNPDLGRLREIIGKANALSALRSGYSLSKAWEIGIGDQRRFRDSLVKSKEELQQAKATVTTGYRGEPDLMELLEAILAYAHGIKTEMEQLQNKNVGVKQ